MMGRTTMMKNIKELMSGNVPEGATHYDTHPDTVCPWHKQEKNGDWAYWKNSSEWKTYTDQSHATTEYFIKL